MHISEGVLSPTVLITGAAVAAVGVGIGLTRTDYDRLPKVAVLSAVFFVASLIHVPVGPASVHLILNGICGIVLGWAAFPAILVGLTLQALLFQYGGLTTLGVNTVIMATPAVVFGYLGRFFLNSDKFALRAPAEFVIGSGAVLTSGLIVAMALIFTGESFTAAAKLIIAAHIPIILLEGVITVFLVEFVRKTKPDFFIEA